MEPPVPRALMPIPPSPQETETELAPCRDTPEQDDALAWDPASHLPSEDADSPGLFSRPEGLPAGPCH
jgi:hypothetical protein